MIALMANLSHYGSDNLAENSSLPTQQDDLILYVIEQLKNQVVNCTKINQDNKNINEILTAELERYKNQVRILKEQNNVDKAYASCAQSLEIENLKHTISKHLKEKESLEQKAVEQHYVEKNKFQDKIKDVLKENERLLEQAMGTNIVNLVVNANVNYACLQEKVLVITALKDTLSKIKGKAVVNEAVPLHSIDPELLKIDVAPLAPKLRNNRTTHTDYLRHTQEETTTLREIVESERLLNPLNTSLDYALGNVCPLTRITTTAIVLFREPIPIESNTTKPVVTLVYLRRSKVAKKKVLVSNSKSLVANTKEPNNSWGSTVSNVPSSVKFENDYVVKIMGYDDYKIGNVTISRVYFMEGLVHNLFFMGQFCDSDLEVAFHQLICFIHNLDGVDLLTDS
nr:integrase, catalytic region, zinc finger, CCHC-type, peptidase aspartic, catalytic [Tanacetum cinerariifolium]